MVLFAFCGLMFVIGFLLTERALFHYRYPVLLIDTRAAIDLAAEVGKLDTRLVTTTHLAAATGAQQWIALHDEIQEKVVPMVRDAFYRLPPEIRDVDQGRLAAICEARRLADQKVLALVRAGDRQAALDLVASDAYRNISLSLSQALTALRDSARRYMDQRVAEAQRRSWIMFSCLAIGGILSFAMIWRRLNRDMVESEAAFALTEARLEHLVSFDPLTGLPNRQRLIEELQQMMVRAERSDHCIAVIALDIDGFRALNDQFGHDLGDRVLREAGRRIAASVRKDEIAARLGDDEFVIAITCRNTHEAPLRVARRIIEALQQPFCFDGLTVTVGATAGISLWPEDSALVDELLRKADVALARAKAESRGDVRFFQPVMDADLRERSLLQNELKQAIANDQIVPYFQPVVDLATGNIRGFEVLARWHHPTRGVIPPVTFISFAEDSGLIGDLTFAIVRSALQTARNWSGDPTIAVNISQKQLVDPQLADKLLNLLAETGFPPHRFEVEVTENALASDIRTAKYILHRLKSRGVCVSLDDFGTGYSCLGHLAHLPVDKIKIDSSFTRTMQERGQSATIVKSIIGLGRSLGLPVIAEGIETAAEARTLLKLGCATAQGYYFSPPVPAGAARQLLGRRLGPDIEAPQASTH